MAAVMPASSSKQPHKRRNTQGEKTRLAILKAAARLFARDGYDKVSIRDIADALDTLPSLIIHHFGTKRELYQKTLEHLIGDGKRIAETVEPLAGLDGTDRQAVANALAECVHRFYEIWHSPQRTKYMAALMLQVVYGRGAEGISGVKQWLSPADDAYRNIFRRVAPHLTHLEIEVRVEIFWGHLFYPSFVRDFLLTEYGWKDFPADWFLHWKKTVARDFCLGIGLPAPAFVFPGEAELEGTPPTELLSRV
ncbi:MAG: TetR/AcrR family transcriptional regulator [Puniceicoccales bacterium]|jgi:AcrR family transcriptional regulator|nr:TetR/AcrR family transcriptional regulator [Puniceicoccales bacterium]